jgi:hydroxyacylglutathione hydrolase
MQLTEDLYLIGSGQKGLSHFLDCDVYAVDAGDEVVLIDAGCGRDTDGLLERLRADGLDPARVRTIFLTHEHSDHACGAATFRERFGARIVCQTAAQPMIERGTDHDLGLDLARPQGVFPADFQYRHCPVGLALGDGESVQVGRLTFRAIATPGHSPGCACYVVDLAAGRALFSGDTVFWGGTVSLLNYSGCDLCAYRESLRKLLGLDADLLLPGHHQFTLRYAQWHLDRAAERMNSIYLPPAPPWIR